MSSLRLHSWRTSFASCTLRSFQYFFPNDWRENWLCSDLCVFVRFTPWLFSWFFFDFNFLEVDEGLLIIDFFQFTIWFLPSVPFLRLLSSSNLGGSEPFSFQLTASLFILGSKACSLFSYGPVRSWDGHLSGVCFFSVVDIVSLVLVFLWCHWFSLVRLFNWARSETIT